MKAVNHVIHSPDCDLVGLLDPEDDHRRPNDIGLALNRAGLAGSDAS